MEYLLLEIVAWAAEIVATMCSIIASWKLLLGGAVAALIGGFATHFFNLRREKERRRQMISNASRILYLELADRVGRCLNDYIKPWHSMRTKVPKYMPRDRFSKFRPQDPVFYPALAREIGDLDSVTVGHLISFYFRLGAISRDNDNWSRSDPVAAQELRLMATRFQESLGPGLEALKSLGKQVPDASAIDELVATRYPHIFRRSSKLRILLEEMSSGS